MSHRASSRAGAAPSAGAKTGWMPRESIDVDLLDGLFDFDTDPATYARDLRRVKGLRFDGTACATCPDNCCIVRKGDVPRGFVRKEIDAIVAAHPEFAFVYDLKRWRTGKDGRRYLIAATSGPCVFLGDDLRCRVYAHRPVSCRVVPATEWWMRGHAELHAWVDDCPGSSYAHPTIALNEGDQRSAALLTRLRSEGRAAISLFVGEAGDTERRALARASARDLECEAHEEIVGPAVAGSRTARAAAGAAYCDDFGVPALALPWRIAAAELRALARALDRNSRLRRDDGIALRVLAPFAALTDGAVRRRYALKAAERSRR